MEGPILKMEGRSGCRLDVLNKNGIYYVRKFSKEQAYNSRLLGQAKKQRAYFLAGQSLHFFTPDVLALSGDDELQAWFEMPYVHGQKYSEFFERASIAEIRDLSKKFKDYFSDAFARAQAEKIDATLFATKMHTLKEVLLFREDINRELLDQAFIFLEQIPSDTILIGQCHGDFTLSNMMFCEGGIYLFDFLDSFVESPLIDLVKFRQDTFFYWSLLIESNFPASRAGKIVQVFNYLDAEIAKNMANNSFVSDWYDYLQIFNLLRILPYVHHAAEIRFVQHGISKLLNPLK